MPVTGTAAFSMAAEYLTGTGLATGILLRVLHRRPYAPMLALIVAGTRVKRQTIQRIGRVLRRTPDKNFARVVKVFVRGGADDPTGSGADSFSRELLAGGRAITTYWPADSATILRFLRKT